MKLKAKCLFKKIKPYCALPHIWTLLIVTVLAIVLLVLSIVNKDTNAFLSSLLSNIFAGLLTGVVICLISTIKAISAYRTERLVSWMNEVHNTCLEFIKMYKRILYCKEGDFSDSEELYNHLYDTLSYSNSIWSNISQGRYNRAVHFNSYNYCKKHFSIDAVKMIESNNSLHDDLTSINIAQLTPQIAVSMLKDTYTQIMDFNGMVISKKEELNAKIKAINTSI